jgi:protein dithiol oxidoreductase (disulfide-forming)
MKTKWMILVAVLLTACTQATAEPVAGKDYHVIDPPVPTAAVNKIEVIEFFYYGCPHCYQLEPHLKSWLKQKPSDVEFRTQPAVFRESWLPLTKAYYALEATGDLSRLHEKLFAALHDQNLQISTDEALFAWVEKQGVDREKFADAYKSFGVQGKTQRAVQMTKEYRVAGTPSIVIDGKYITSGGMTGSHESMMKVVDYLIAKARDAKGQKS